MDLDCRLYPTEKLEHLVLPTKTSGWKIIHRQSRSARAAEADGTWWLRRDNCSFASGAHTINIGGPCSSYYVTVSSNIDVKHLHSSYYKYRWLILCNSSSYYNYRWPIQLYSSYYEILMYIMKCYEILWNYDILWNIMKYWCILYILYKNISPGMTWIWLQFEQAARSQVQTFVSWCIGS